MSSTIAIGTNIKLVEKKDTILKWIAQTIKPK